MGNVVQTPLAYHPKNLLYDIDFFSGLSGFQQASVTHASKLYPKLPFFDFLPPFLWDEWNTLESWPADFTVELTPSILKTVVLSTFPPRRMMEILCVCFVVFGGLVWLGVVVFFFGLLLTLSISS